MGQVAERALFLWNKDVVATITADHRDTILPILFPAVTSTHWNKQVNELTSNIVRMFKEMDIELWNNTERKFQQINLQKKEKENSRQRRWAKLKQIANSRLASSE